MKSDEVNEEVDVGIGLDRVGQAGEGLVGVPLGRDAGHHLDHVLVLVDHVEEAVAALDGVHVAQVADHDAGLVLAALLLGLVDQELHGVGRMILRLSAWMATE